MGRARLKNNFVSRLHNFPQNWRNETTTTCQQKEEKLQRRQRSQQREKQQRSQQRSEKLQRSDNHPNLVRV